MPDKYVIFPGGTGNNISTDDINILNGDQAHMQQASSWPAAVRLTKLWETHAGTPIGTMANKLTMTDETSVSILRLGDESFSIAGSTVYSAAVWIEATNAMAIQFGLTEFDAGGSVLGTSTYGPTLDFAAGEKGWVPATVTTDALTVSGDLRLQFPLTDSGHSIGDIAYQGAAIIREGSDPTFVPSLNIVGTLGETTDPTAMPITYTPGSPLTVGEAWAGHGYSYIRYDGTVGVGPIVADFDPDDIVLP